MRGFFCWGGHRKDRPGRIQPALLPPSPGAAEGVMVSLSVSGVRELQWHLRCNGERAGRQVIAGLVHMLMYIWAREKMLPLKLLPDGHRAITSDTGRSSRGRQHLILRAWAQPLRVFTSTYASIHAPSSYQASIQGG